METFTHISAVAAPLMRVNIDTDIIIPSREMKRVSKKGLSDGLFAGWRYTDPAARSPDPEFVLNDPRYLSTQILIAGANFGCGSSREHAVWALAEYGIRAIIAPSFSAIFYNNCISNGILPVELPEAMVDALAMEAVGGSSGVFGIDLQEKQITPPDGSSVPFEIEATARQILLDGLDPIERTLNRADAITAFEAKRFTANPWAKLA